VIGNKNKLVRGSADAEDGPRQKDKPEHGFSKEVEHISILRRIQSIPPFLKSWPPSSGPLLRLQRIQRFQRVIDRVDHELRAAPSVVPLLLVGRQLTAARRLVAVFDLHDRSVAPYPHKNVRDAIPQPCQLRLY